MKKVSDEMFEAVKDKFTKFQEIHLNLLENDYLGGSGSRGYGRVEFSNKDEWVEK